MGNLALFLDQSLAPLREWAGRWGDIASVAGLLLSAVGFAVTIVQVRRSKTAAEQAREAAVTARRKIVYHDLIADLSTAIAIMDEIKRLQRQTAWSVLPERYSELRRRLTSINAIRGENDAVMEPHRETLSRALEIFKKNEDAIEAGLARRRAPKNPVKLNQVTSARIDEVHEILVALRLEASK